MWGRGWLNLAFYERVFREMPEHVELVLAERNGKVVAGAFNVASAVAGGEASGAGAPLQGRLYGRYWGCFEDHPFLHFNVCYYHSIEALTLAEQSRCSKVARHGEHKLSGAFCRARTRTARISSSTCASTAGVRDHLRRETPEREAALARWREEASGYRSAGPRAPQHQPREAGA